MLEWRKFRNFWGEERKQSLHENRSNENFFTANFFNIRIMKWQGSGQESIRTRGNDCASPAGRGGVPRELTERRGREEDEGREREKGRRRRRAGVVPRKNRRLCWMFSLYFILDPFVKIISFFPNKRELEGKKKKKGSENSSR